MQRGGIELLGAVADGSYAVALGGSFPTPPVAKRRTRVAMSEAALEVGGRQPAWQIGRLCVATSLNYDASVNSAAVIEPHAQRVRAGLVEALSASAGAELIA